MSNELDNLLQELEGTVSNREEVKDVKFPLDFYPKKEQLLMKKLNESKGLSLQHLGLGMLPIFSRIYNKYRATAFNGAFDTVPVFWVAIVDQPGSNKSESLKSWYNQLKKHNNYDDPEMPVTYTSNDTTPEGLIHNMKGQANGLYLFYDEITSFTGGIGQYKKDSSSDKAFWLSLWSGGDVTQFRVNGGIRHMQAQSVSVAGTTQPDTLRKAFSKDLSNGFFDRFLWSVESNPIPDIPENPDYDIDERVYLRIREHIDAPKFDSVIKFNADAKQLLVDWYNSTRAAIGDDPIKRQFFGKDIIYVNRLALMTNILYNTGDTLPINIDSAERAIRMIEFCGAMRQRSYKLVSEEDITESIFDKYSIARWLVNDDPAINKSELAKALNISRRSLYE